jgi:hypothetical protein
MSWLWKPKSISRTFALSFFEALKQNALFLVAIPYFLVVFYTSFNKEKYQKLRQLLLGDKALLILLIFIILFGIIRNL